MTKVPTMKHPGFCEGLVVWFEFRCWSSLNG